VQTIAKVTIEWQYEFRFDLSNGVISSDIEWSLTLVSRSWYFLKANVTKRVHFRDKIAIGC